MHSLQICIHPRTAYHNNLSMPHLYPLLTAASKCSPPWKRLYRKLFPGNNFCNPKTQRSIETLNWRPRSRPRMRWTCHQCHGENASAANFITASQPELKLLAVCSVKTHQCRKESVRQLLRRSLRSALMTKDSLRRRKASSKWHCTGVFRRN